MIFAAIRPALFFLFVNILKKIWSELLQKKDFETISVTEIVKAAGINRSTFYAHYNNMTEVLEEIEKQVADGILKSFMSYEESVMENPTPFLKSIASLLQKDFDFYKRLICANVGSHFIDKLKEHYGPVPAPLVNLVNIAVAKNYAKRLGIKKIVVADKMAEVVFKDAEHVRNQRVFNALAQMNETCNLTNDAEPKVVFDCKYLPNERKFALVCEFLSKSAKTFE